MKNYIILLFSILISILFTSCNKPLSLEEFDFADKWELKEWRYGDSLFNQSHCTKRMHMILEDDSSMTFHFVNSDCSIETQTGKWYIDDKGRFVKWTEIMPEPNQIADILKISGDENFEVQPHQSHQHSKIILINKNTFKTQIELWPAPWELEKEEEARATIETMLWKRVK